MKESIKDQLGVVFKYYPKVAYGAIVVGVFIGLVIGAAV